MLTGLVLVAVLSAEPRDFAVLGLGCANGPPRSLDVLAVVGRGSNARVVQWVISRGVTSEMDFHVIDPMQPSTITRHALTERQWPAFLKALEFPPELTAGELAALRAVPVRVVWKKRCALREESLELAIPRVETRANQRLLAAALAMIRLIEPTFHAPAPSTDGGG